MPDQVGHDFTIDGIYNPDHEVFATGHENRCRVMPLDKIKILLRNIFDCLLECKVILDVPDTQEVVHSAGDEPLAR